MPDRQLSKAQLRDELRRRRLALGQQAQLAAAKAATENIRQLPDWDHTRRVALYLACDGEIDTSPLITLCRHLDKQVFLPVINADNSLAFALWTAEAELQANRYGIGEPPADAPRCPAGELDMVVLPLVGWDRDGGRLGMGGGFYDRTLAGIRDTLLVGLAHSVQEAERIPREDWDVPLDYVVTEMALHRCQVPGRAGQFSP